jgi:hypothetical protein
LLDEADELAELGVTWLSIKLASPDRATFVDNVARFGDEVIASDRRRAPVVARNRDDG